MGFSSLFFLEKEEQEKPHQTVAHAIANRKDAEYQYIYVHIP
jgi:hypothetical protein